VAVPDGVEDPVHGGRRCSYDQGKKDPDPSRAQTVVEGNRGHQVEQHCERRRRGTPRGAARIAIAELKLSRLVYGTVAVLITVGLTSCTSNGPLKTAHPVSAAPTPAPSAPVALICPAGWPKYLCPQPPAGFSADAFRDVFARGEASPNGVAHYFAERFEVADSLASPEKWFLTYQDTFGGMMPRRSGESTAEYQREICSSWTFQRFVTVRNQPGVVCADQQYEVSVSWGGSEQVYTDRPANPTIDHGRVTVADATGTAALLYSSADLVAAINGWKPVKGQ
jgi:hypothetical protein